MSTPATAMPIQAPEFKVACSNCNLRELCLPVGLTDRELERLDSLVATRRTLRRGELLFHSGDAFESLFAVRTGFFKTRVASEDGRDHRTTSYRSGRISCPRHAKAAVRAGAVPA